MLYSLVEGLKIILQTDAHHTESKVSWTQNFLVVHACAYSYPDLMRCTKVNTKTQRKRKTEGKPYREGFTARCICQLPR